MTELSEVTTKISSIASRLTGGGTSEASRSLPIRAKPEKVEKLWESDENRREILADIPADDAVLNRGEDQGKWGTTFRVSLGLEERMPAAAGREMAAKVVRRLKSLAETGEIPTTERNPSYREDAGEER